MEIRLVRLRNLTISAVVPGYSLSHHQTAKTTSYDSFIQWWKIIGKVISHRSK
jgi:hypothetical protein